MATYCTEDGGDRELFSCPICFEDYDLQDARRAPKLLLCLHTFCYECTQKLWKDGLLECSMCRMLHEKVRLEDLFDNHVIIQHLQKEREEQDLELARRIDQELRNEYGGSPVIVADSNAMEEQNDTVVDYSGTIEILDSTDENIETDETDLTAPEENSPRVSNIEDDQEEEVHERSECQSSIFAEFLEALRANSDSEDENDGDEENNDAEDDIIVSVVSEGGGPVANDDDDHDNDDQSDDSNEDGSGNPIFCFEHIHDLLRANSGDEDNDEGEQEEESEEEEVNANVEVNENPPLMMENIQCLFGYAENDDDDEEDERFHSACDDISTSFWVGDEDLPNLCDGSEDDTDTNAYCWQIVNQETSMDD